MGKPFYFKCKHFLIDVQSFPFWREKVLSEIIGGFISNHTVCDVIESCPYIYYPAFYQSFRGKNTLCSFGIKRQDDCTRFFDENRNT